MEPSALPAFSAPSGVSSAPSLAASAAETAAAAGPPIIMPASIERQGSSAFLIMVSSRRSERVLERGRDEVAVVQVVETSRTRELGPGHIDRPGGAQVRFDTEREAITALDEVATRSGRGALHVMLPVEARQDVPGTHEPRVFEPAGDAIAIRSCIREAVLRLHQVERQAVGRRERGAVTAAQFVVAADVGGRAI